MHHDCNNETSKKIFTSLKNSFAWTIRNSLHKAAVRQNQHFYRKQAVELDLSFKQTVELDLSFKQTVELDLSFKQTVELDLSFKQTVELDLSFNKGIPN